MTTVYDIQTLLVKGLKGICEAQHLQDRPLASDKTGGNFMVINLGSRLTNEELSDDLGYNWQETYAMISVFVKDEQTASNTNKARVKTLSALTEEVRGKFPLLDAGLNVKAYRPRIIVPGAGDGNGYHYSTVQVRITTLI